MKNAEASINRDFAADPVILLGAVAAYEDDTQIRAEIRVLGRVDPQMKGIFGANVFTVNVTKSEVSGRMVDEIWEETAELVMNAKGMVALGVPVGLNTYRKRMMEEMAKKMEPPAAALKLLRPRTALDQPR